MIQKELSNSIINRVTINNKIIHDWFEDVQKSVINRFYKHKGNLTPFYAALFATEDASKYDAITDVNIPEGDQGYYALLKHNYLHGYPVMVCSFSSLIFCYDQYGKEKEAVLITLETPLHSRKKIYLVTEVAGEKHLVMDGYMTKFGTLHPNVQKYCFLIDVEKQHTS